MKDIYELLNDVDMGDNEFEEMKVSEFERARVKKAVKESIHRKKKLWKKGIVAAALVAGISTAALGATFPAYASSIPIIGNIFRYLDLGTGVYQDYKEYSSTINMSQESNGIKVTINDAIFDGETVSLTYSIESNKDLGADPIIQGFLDIKGAEGMAGSNQITKVDQNHYVGLITGSGFHPKEKDKVELKWNIESITIQDSNEKITGNWNFALALKATESDTQLINRRVDHDGVSVNIDKISVTPMSFIVYYDQVVSEKVRNKWGGVDVSLEIKDDIGNHYAGKDNGGFGDDSEGYNIHLSNTFEKLDPKATKLIITPHLSLYEHTADNHGGVEITEDGSKEIPIPQKSGKGKEEYTLDDIVIELKK
ncbi:DUF4179 domain-containing protein [Paenibacillus sp. KQZ6P-2]|uniref:DUF4179 domain-containing protein n=1 Tax=Paenibacillus mangrovi TaxID=2931978 RepID=A0A9X1WQS6_9BACL|nr:DUF4179 domain-containing protein [Paenibacillus mangrovi]MCJ8012966.1 DUF4179 domain-containing protein [Paenibacillus mangrovi]